MPHATNDEAMGSMDEDAAFAAFTSYRPYGQDLSNDVAFDQEGKAANAEDFGDISDDDLPDEVEATNHINDDEDLNGFLNQVPSGFGGLPGQPADHHANGYHGDQDVKEQHAGDLFGESDDIHDLFGEHSSSPEQRRAQPTHHAHPPPQRPGGLALPSKSSLALPGLVNSYQPPRPRQPQHSPASMSPPPSFRADGYSPTASYDDDESDDAGLSKKEREQKRLFKTAARRQAGEAVEDEAEEIPMDVFYNLYPRFEKNQIPDFVDLFPPRNVSYRGKVPPKPPRPVQPTKLSLDVLPDQEKGFRAPGFGGKGNDETMRRDGLVHLIQNSRGQDVSDDDLDLSTSDDDERIGGISMQDLAMICGDWDEIASTATAEDALMEGEWEAEERTRPRKKRRIDFIETDFSLSLHDPYLTFEHPERAAAKLAKAVSLDLNDSNLLLDEIAPQHRRKTTRAAGDGRRGASLSKDIAKRYNISNDEAYDLLKENHQHKVRSTLSGMAIEHSMPAAKLQYPFYKINLDNKAKRSFHRPHLDLRDFRGRDFRFQKTKHIKRKHLRGREIKDVFAKSDDLALGDNANVLLLEYSEEAPVMMSNFGMGNRLINYYRKRDADDQERPKREIGETQVLLVQDKSPFANFGHVNKGEVVPAIQNGLYRAPVFYHQPKSNEFLVGVSSTHQSGHRFYLRNVENLHTVGQQFPLVEVPGEHSRKVTDAAKKRLRALSYRMYSKSIDPVRRGPPLNNENLMPHLPGHDMPQTRSKMREFMKYDRAPGKEGNGVWVPMPGAVVPDAETLRSWIKPEDVCLLDSMQVGVQHLTDLGISIGKETEEDKEAEEGDGIEKQLAPWQTTKNFIGATQGKAMLKLHGEGDPTGRGEGFSFVKTSMKGGFEAIGQPVEAKIEAKKRREAGGHTYNVAQQQKLYDDHIRQVWDKQKESLNANHDISDVEMDDEADEPQSAYPFGRAATPRSSLGTPAAFLRHDDESASQFSRGSADRGDKALTITRKSIDKYGKGSTSFEKVTNPKVMELYRKRKMERQLKQLRFASSHLYQILTVRVLTTFVASSR